MAQHTSCLQAQRIDFIGSLSCKCRIIVMCSVNVKRQVWRAFQIEGGEDEFSHRADMGGL